MKGQKESQSNRAASLRKSGYGFLDSSGALPEAGGQFMPAKGFSGFTRGEQRWASGAAFSPPACAPVGGWS